ncbi:TIGR03986 family CRISPR-associated RAMP protein [bacterium]|nr:TIGR03986 family CRISPR-associated RAMP protein [bacterium]
MPLPKHKNPTTEDRTACAPYNFVPLPEKVAVAGEPLPRDRYHSDRHTGTIHCRLTTETPIYTRAALEQHEADTQAAKDKADFFYVDSATKTPVIPGSSLRGVLRSLMEIVAYSKVYAVRSTPLAFRTFTDKTSLAPIYRNRLMSEDQKNHFTPRVIAGYIERHQGQVANHDGEWVIRPAKAIDGVTFARIPIRLIPRRLPRWHGCRNASQVWVKLGPYEYQPVQDGRLQIKYAKVQEAVDHAPTSSGFETCVLVKSGYMSKKLHETVVYPADKNDNNLIPIPTELVYAYQDQISPEQKKLLGENGVLQEHQPVFYLLEQQTVGAKPELVFFGHTMMMRMTYPFAPLDFVPESLRNAEDLDLAEAIFGCVEDGNHVSKTCAGRVYVSDAQLSADQTDESIWLTATSITPKILSGPKPTTFQHYLTQQTPDATPAGYTKDRQPKTEIRLQSYADRPGIDTVIRGHKLYWHKGGVNVEEIQESAETLEKLAKVDDKQHTRIKPVNAGVRFEFQIAFENLSEVELGALLWVLMLPGDSNKEYRHHVGMGKPLGMGTVKLEPELHLSQRVQRYAELFQQDDWHKASWVATSAEVAALLDAFDHYVRTQTVQLQSANTLLDLDRIQTLLKLLEWPGPDHEQTRYMEIEYPDPNAKRGKRNQYDSRPVLPDPLQIQVEQKPQSKAKGSSVVAEPERAQVRNPIALLQTGQVVSGTVVRFKKARFYIDIGAEHEAELHKREFVGRNPPNPGDEIEVQIEEVADKKHIRLILPAQG